MGKHDKKARMAAEEAETEHAHTHTESVPPAGEEEEREETPEERAARKAAKAARKAERRARREAAAAAGEAEDACVEEDAPAGADGSRRPGKATASADGADGGAAAAAAGKKRRRDDSEGAETSAPTSSGGTVTVWPSYSVPAGVKAMAQSVVDDFRAEKRITVEDPLDASASWKPLTSFKHAGDIFSADMMECTRTFKEPSPIQAQCWPIVLAGRDIVGIAQTGSGKTLAFTLPALLHIHCRRTGGLKEAKDAPTGKNVASKGPVVLVMAPTRELAMQSAKVALEAGSPAGVHSVCLYGGVPKDAQRRELNVKGGVHFIVATPGRLLDFVEDGTVDLGNVTYVVLDEADRMLDMGFEKDIRAIMGKLRTRAQGRQTLMFSATWPPAIQGIAAEFLHQPVKVTIGSAELAASSTVTQIVEVMEPNDRDNYLLKLLNKYHASRTNRIIIFALYKKEAARLERFLAGRGWSVGAIHGDMTQEARTRAFHAFRNGEVPLLVATDVAARGLDIPNVEYVINFTFPLTIEDYVHRIGRTGRAGRKGIAHTLFTALDKAHAGELVNVLKEAGAPVPDALIKFGTHIKKKEHSLYGSHFKAEGGAAAAPAAKAHMKFDE